MASTVSAEPTFNANTLTCLVSPALNRSREFASRPGVCPTAEPESFSPSCSLDTDCSGLQKCCSWPGVRRCVSPTPTGRGAKRRVSGRHWSGGGGSHSCLGSLELRVGQTGVCLSPRVVPRARRELNVREESSGGQSHGRVSGKARLGTVVGLLELYPLRKHRPAHISRPRAAAGGLACVPTLSESFFLPRGLYYEQSWTYAHN